MVDGKGKVSLILFAIVMLAFVAISAAGCSSVGAAKNNAYRYLADKGNTYCDEQTESRQAIKDAINANLKEAGAKFTFEGINCT